MVKLMVVYGRNRNFSRQEFLEYQCGPHMKTAGSVRAFCERIRGSVQNTIYTGEDHLPLDEDHPVQLTGKDSIVEIYFDSAQDVLDALHHPDYLATVRPDEEYFSDAENSWSLITDEFVSLGDKEFEGKEKLFLFFRLAESMDIDELKRVWPNLRQGFQQTLSRFGIGKMVESYCRPDAKLENAGKYHFAIELCCAELQDVINIAQSSELRFALLACQALFSEALIYIAQGRTATPG